MRNILRLYLLTELLASPPSSIRLEACEVNGLSILVGYILDGNIKGFFIVLLSIPIGLGQLFRLYIGEQRRCIVLVG